MTKISSHLAHIDTRLDSLEKKHTVGTAKLNSNQEVLIKNVGSLQIEKNSEVMITRRQYEKQRQSDTCAQLEANFSDPDFLLWADQDCMSLQEKMVIPGVKTLTITYMDKILTSSYF